MGRSEEPWAQAGAGPIGIGESPDRGSGIAPAPVSKNPAKLCAIPSFPAAPVKERENQAEMALGLEQSV